MICMLFIPSRNLFWRRSPASAASGVRWALYKCESPSLTVNRPLAAYAQHPAFRTPRETDPHLQILAERSPNRNTGRDRRRRKSPAKHFGPPVFAQTEVGEAQPAFPIEHDVARLQIAVHHALFVRGSQSGA